MVQIDSAHPGMASVTTEAVAAPSLWRPLALAGPPALCVVMLLLPPPAGMADPAWRVAAVVILMALWWMTEIVPMAATALLPLALFPLLGIQTFEQVVPSYADPLIFLFMGGFILAMAMQRWRLDQRIALQVLRLVGCHPQSMVGGVMLATTLISMWVSNTAAAMMMLPIGLSLLAIVGERCDRQSRDYRNFAAALMLGIAYGASIGGVGTLIGTAPNIMFASYVADHFGVTIGFGAWMAVGVTVIAIMVPLAWVILVHVVCRFRLPAALEGRDAIDGRLAALGPMQGPEKAVATLFLLAVALWVMPASWHVWLESVAQLSDAGVAVIVALCLFVLPVDWRRGRFLMSWDDAVKIPWGVLLLFGGGLAMARTIGSAGLDDWIAQSLTGLDALPLPVLLTMVSVIVVVLSELGSNTAVAALFLPMIGTLAVDIGENPLMLLIPVILSASIGFMLPVATPPNAIVYASGAVPLRTMLRAGFFLNIVGILAALIATQLVATAVFDIQPGVVPPWAVRP